MWKWRQRYRKCKVKIIYLKISTFFLKTLQFFIPPPFSYCVGDFNHEIGVPEYLIVHDPDEIPETEEFTSSTNSPTTVFPTTTGSQDCFPNPCQHDGLCVDNSMFDSNYTCFCAESFTGKNCEIVDSCSQTDICNNGTCIENGMVVNRNLSEISHFLDAEVYSLLLLSGESSTNLTDFQCDCEAGFTGENCETIIPCSQNLCENNSTCINSNDLTDYFCVCQTVRNNLNSYTGKNCEIEAPCNENNNPCENNSTCTNSFDLSSYTCNCPISSNIAFTGANCEIEAPCNENLNPCLNNSTCINSQDLENYHCSCENTNSTLFTGQNCEIEAPCNHNPCFNSAECINSLNWADILTNQLINDDFSSFSCLCSGNFTGANCEIDAPCNNVSPCQNGAICENSLDLSDYSCECLEEINGMVFTGKNCDVDAVCNDDTVCENGGICVNNQSLDGHA